MSTTKKKKLLWIGDDLRMNSGVATQLRELVLGLIDEYDICAIAGAIQHPEAGKVIDLSEATQKLTGVKDANIRLYPTNGYGDENIIFAIINQEKPDAVCMITDPRFYGWLFAIERQIRTKIPIIYWALWDDVPYPMWNRPGYMSCDGVFAISKQSNNIHKHVIGAELCCSLDGEFDAQGNLIKKENV
jgi:hypothetical protein